MNCLLGNGSAYVQLGAEVRVSAADPAFTLSFRAPTTSVGNNPILGDLSSQQVRPQTTSTMRVQINNSNFDFAYPQAGTGAPTICTIVRDESEHVTVYQDGVASSSGPQLLGGDFSIEYLLARVGSVPFTGLLYDVRLWIGRSLTAAQVAELAATNPVEPDHWWPCHEGTGTTVADVIGGNDGTLSAESWSTQTEFDYAALIAPSDPYAGLQAADDLHNTGIYTQPVVDDMDLATLTPNTAAWEVFDWSGVACLTDRDDAQVTDNKRQGWCATLISEHWAIVANHTSGAIGYHWRGKDGLEYSSAVDRAERIGTTDLAVVKLTTPPPLAQCARYRIALDADVWDGARVVSPSLDRTLKVRVQEGGVTAGGLIHGYIWVAQLVRFAGGEMQNGESSMPIFSTYQGELILHGVNNFGGDLSGGKYVNAYFEAAAAWVAAINAELSIDSESVGTVTPEFTTLTYTHDSPKTLTQTLAGAV